MDFGFFCALVVTLLLENWIVEEGGSHVVTPPTMEVILAVLAIVLVVRDLGGAELDRETRVDLGAGRLTVILFPLFIVEARVRAFQFQFFWHFYK